MKTVLVERSVITEQLKKEIKIIQNKITAITTLLVESEDFSISFIEKKFQKFNENLLGFFKKIKTNCRVMLFCRQETLKGEKKNCSIAFYSFVFTH